MPNSNMLKNVKVQELSPYQRSYGEFYRKKSKTDDLKQLCFVSKPICK